jgi:hypothetical protein
MKALSYTVLGIIVLAVLGGMCSKTSVRPFDQTQLLKEINESSSISYLVSTKVVHRVEIRADGVSLIVGPAFYRLPFENKIVTAQTVSSIVGPSRGGSHFLLYDWQTDKKVGSWMDPGGLNLQ